MLVFFTYIDRSNLAFAAFQFKKDINLSNTVYGLGASEYRNFHDISFAQLAYENYSIT